MSPRQGSARVHDAVCARASTGSWSPVSANTSNLSAVLPVGGRWPISSLKLAPNVLNLGLPPSTYEPRRLDQRKSSHEDPDRGVGGECA